MIYRGEEEHGPMFEQILTKEVLENDYCKNQMSTAAIAHKYETTAVTVQHYIKLHGISLRPLTQDLTGKRFGRLIVIRPSGRDKHQKARWHCKCDCGVTTEINASSLIRNLTTSCGCLKKELCQKGGYKDISRCWWRRMSGNANQRGYEFEITPEYIWGLYEKQNRICPLSGLPLVFYPDSNRAYRQTASIDRIDSSKGYIEGNVQIVHKAINQMKSFFNEDEFFAFCNLVAKKNPMSIDDSINKASRNVLRKTH